MYMHVPSFFHIKTILQTIVQPIIRAPTNILRTLPMLQFQPRAPAAVAPLPEKTRFDRELTVELDTLRSQGGEIGLAQFLDAAITTQKIASNSLSNVFYKDHVDRGAIDKYLEDNVEILDACNYSMNKIEHINKYMDSLRVVVHLVDKGAMHVNALSQTRALELLESSSCQSMEKRRENYHHGSCLKKMLRQKLCYHETELSEVMCGSKAMALMCCRFLELGLSFDSKRGLPMMKVSQPMMSCSWLRLLEELEKQVEKKKKVQKRRCWSSLLMAELQQTVAAARELKEQIKGKREKDMKYGVERLKMSCMELEHGVEILDERVKILYKCLIDVRMSLLGILSQPTTV